MNQDYNGYTKRKLIEMAKNQGISTSGAKQDIIHRLKNDTKRRPSGSKRISQEEYDRQVAILNKEKELDEMEHEMKVKQLRLRKLRLDAQLAQQDKTEEKEESETTTSKSEDEDQQTDDKEAYRGTFDSPHSIQPVATNFVLEDHELDQQVSELFQLDHVENYNLECHSAKGKKVIDLWDESTQVNNDQCSLQLPSKEKPPNLPDKRETAERKPESLVQNRQSKEQNQEYFAEEIKKMLEKDYAERIEEKKRPPRLTWYLLHHSVFDVNKPDKIRFVFDCNIFPTKALAGTGNIRKYCNTSMAQSLQLEGTQKTINIQTLHGTNPSEFEMVDFDVFDLQSSFKVKFKDVYVTTQFPCLRSSVATKPDVEEMSHLTDISISNSEDDSFIIRQNQSEAIFLQMEVQEQHSHALRLLYWENGEPGGTINTYQIKRNLFGETASSITTNYDLKGKSKKFEYEYFDKRGKALDQSFYVDDILYSCTLDDEPPTRNHLLLMQKGLMEQPGTYHKQDEYTKPWMHCQYIADRFWSRWLNEYIPIIQHRSKWLDEQQSIQQGDLVLLCDEIVPRNHWPLGRVTAVHKGRDGRVRSATVKTTKGAYDRPVTKLCLLEEFNRQL